MKLPSAKRGFTLIEMLLVIIVVMLLAGVSIAYFGGLLRGTRLNEGASRFSSLLRFARAEAANSGRRIQIQFTPASTNLAGPTHYQPTIKCELEPINEPGVYRELNDPIWRDGQLTELASVASVHSMDAEIPVASTNEFTNEFYLAEEDLNDTNEITVAPQPITFYPDGSSDSAEITLVSTDLEDERRIQITLNGLTGTVSQESVNLESTEIETMAEETEEELALDSP